MSVEFLTTTPFGGPVIKFIVAFGIQDREVFPFVRAKRTYNCNAICSLWANILDGNWDDDIGPRSLWLPLLRYSNYWHGR